MMQSNSFFTLLKAEHYKTKRNKGVLLMLLLPIFVTLLIDLYMIYEYTDAGYQFAHNPWSLLLGRYTFNFYMFIYPLVIAIFCYSFCDIEYKHNSLKQLFTLPTTKQNIFLAKSVLMVEIILISVLTAYFLFMLSGYIMSYTMPNYSFQNYDSRAIIAIFFLKMFIASTALAFIQFFLSMTFKNFTVPVGVACFSVVFMLIANRWEYIDYFPYVSIYKAYLSFLGGSTELISKNELICIGYIVVFLPLCYWKFRNLINPKG